MPEVPPAARSETSRKYPPGWLSVALAAGLILFRQIVVGIKCLGIVLGLGVETAILDHQIDAVGHVLIGYLERPLALGLRRAIQRNRQLKTLRERVDLAALRIGVEDRLRRGFRILLG